ncbi:hypothetical protein [Natrinema sp. H-ect4]|uniref:hypothetical protein n=1 Tax=Natrinema sp. H-ect4 TaxID=3242699 RepID=UPI0035A947AF
MSIQNRPSDQEGYETDAERWLEGGNDMMVESTIRGISDIERAQRFIKWEAQHQERHWVMNDLKQKISELGER